MNIWEIDKAMREIEALEADEELIDLDTGDVISMADALEKMDKAAALFLKIIELLSNIAVDMLLSYLPQLLVADLTKAAQSFYSLRRVLQHIVHECAYFRRLEACRLIGFCLQSVLAEIRKLAGGEFIYLGCAQPELLPV